MREFATLLGMNELIPVPLETEGGMGTRDLHWSETLFGNEISTGFLGEEINPLSRLTIAALQDMGYQVNLDAADPYELPNSFQLSLMDLNADLVDQNDSPRCTKCERRGQNTQPILLPSETLI